ncbi:MAG: sigma-70 family RNA polymerase sigma factor [Candidatus Sericytochromatia bacterium]|nr:sigma-70 family RNA polymerase sigma factor [Candidatus Sericytochromatia bacterium]
MNLLKRPRTGERTNRTALVRAAQAGDERAFRALVGEVQERLWQVARRLCGDDDRAADLVQESLIRAFRALPRLREPERFMPWLLRILNHLATDMLGGRQADSLEELAESGFEPLADASRSPEALAEAAGLGEVIDRALGRLPMAYRQPLVLRHVLDLSHDDMAQILDLPVGTVKTRLFRGRELLREQLLKEGIRP